MAVAVTYRAHEFQVAPGHRVQHHVVRQAIGAQRRQVGQDRVVGGLGILYDRPRRAQSQGRMRFALQGF